MDCIPGVVTRRARSDSEPWHMICDYFLKTVPAWSGQFGTRDCNNKLTMFRQRLLSVGFELREGSERIRENKDMPITRDGPVTTGVVEPATTSVEVTVQPWTPWPVNWSAVWVG